MRGMLLQIFEGGLGVVAAVRICIGAGRHETDRTASVAVKIPRSLVGAAARSVISAVLIRHERPQRRHAVLLFRHLLAAIAEVALAVETEATAAVGRGKPHLFSRQQRGGVNRITQREWARAAGKARVQDHFDVVHLPTFGSHRKEQPTA